MQDAETAEKQVDAFLEMLEGIESKTSSEFGVRSSEADNSFAGVLSETADRTMLQQAREMEEDGTTSEEIRQATGWFRGYDGKWRYEIDDSDTSIKLEWIDENPSDIRKFIDLHGDEFEGYELEQWQENRIKEMAPRMEKIIPQTLGQFLNADNLYKAYPELKNIKIGFLMMRGSVFGEYNEETKEIYINYRHIKDTARIKETLLHEIQDAIQAIEGYAGGSDIGYWSNPQNIKTERERKNTAYQNYLNTAGEIEARDTAARADLTEAERKETRPDIYRTDVVFADGGVSYSINHKQFTENEIEENINYVISKNSVYDINADLLKKTGKKPSVLFTDAFSKWGGVLKTSQFGDVNVKASSVKSEIRHGITAEKIASIEAIPTVLEQGRVIFSSYKNNTDVERIVVAAPIKIAAESYLMGVMLQRDSQNQRLYLHNVVIEKEGPKATQADLLTTGALDADNPLFISTILQRVINVKNNSEDLSLVDDTEQIDAVFIEPVNDITDKNKYEYLVKDFKRNGWQGRPVVVVENGNNGYIALTGSHRIYAAKEADIPVNAIVLEYSDELADLVNALGDDDRTREARQLQKDGVITKEIADLIAREEELNEENYGVDYDKQTRWSLVDSDGNELSEKQQAYFADSVVRDADGQLQVVYHGTTAYERFNTFKRGKGGYLGPGSYFTVDESYAKRYATAMGDDGQMYKAYLNIKIRPGL